MSNEKTLKPLAIARLLASAMMAGVLLFWVVALIVGSHREATNALPLSSNTITVGMAVLAFVSFLVASVLQNNAVQQKDDAVTHQRLVTAWAVLELPALFAGVCVFSFGLRNVLFGAALFYFAGMLKTFPRSEWFTP